MQEEKVECPSYFNYNSIRPEPRIDTFTDVKAIQELDESDRDNSRRIFFS